MKPVNIKFNIDIDITISLRHLLAQLLPLVSCYLMGSWGWVPRVCIIALFVVVFDFFSYRRSAPQGAVSDMRPQNIFITVMLGMFTAAFAFIVVISRDTLATDKRFEAYGLAHTVPQSEHELEQAYRGLAVTASLLIYSILILYGHNYKHKQEDQGMSTSELMKIVTENANINETCNICSTNKADCSWIDCPHVMYCMECYNKYTAKNRVRGDCPCCHKGTQVERLVFMTLGNGT